jgi:hypothetical protein
MLHLESLLKGHWTGNHSVQKLLIGRWDFQSHQHTWEGTLSTGLSQNAVGRDRKTNVASEKSFPVNNF